jgi:hypothetical protein
MSKPGQGTFNKQSIFEPGEPQSANALWLFLVRMPQLRSWPHRNLAGAEGEGEMTMRALLILITIFFSANAFAQTAPPKVGGKPLKQVKPQTQMGCKLVGTVKGTKLWAGDCAGGSELRGTTPTAEPAAPAPAPEANPPAAKQ